MEKRREVFGFSIYDYESKESFDSEHDVATNIDTNDTLLSYSSTNPSLDTYGVNLGTPEFTLDNDHPYCTTLIGIPNE